MMSRKDYEIIAFSQLIRVDTLFWSGWPEKANSPTWLLGLNLGPSRFLLF